MFLISYNLVRFKQNLILNNIYINISYIDTIVKHVLHHELLEKVDSCGPCFEAKFKIEELDEQVSIEELDVVIHV
jgi:hypothetical protein